MLKFCRVEITVAGNIVQESEQCLNHHEAKCLMFIFMSVSLLSYHM